MQSQVSEISPVMMEVKVQVPWEAVQKDLEEGYTRYQRTAKLKGFRQGKVPRNVVKQFFGPQVKSEVVSNIIERSLINAVQEHAIMPVATPEVDPQPFKDGEPLSYTAKIEVRPKVDNLDTDGLELMRASGDVADEDVNREIKNLQEQNATLETPEPMRAALATDIVTINYKVEIEGTPRPDLETSDRQVELGQDRLLPEFETALVGSNIGDTKTVAIRFQDDHSAEDLRGKNAVFAVTLKDIKHKALPELDDEFAKDCGPFQTLLELRLDVRKKLEEAAKQRVENGLKEQAIERLVDKNPIPVPPSLVSQEEHQMAHDISGFLRMSGQQMQMPDDVTSRIRERAERKVRAALLFGEIARREKMMVAPDDIEKRLQAVAERTGKHIAKVRVDYQGERREGLVNQILEGKILDYLLARATIKDAPAEATSTEKA